MVAATFVVQKLFENHAFPWTVNFALGAVPIPTFTSARKVPTFPVPNTFAALVAVTFVVQKLFENQAFPWTVRFALGAVPIPTFEVARKVDIFAVSVTFALFAITFVVQKLFDTHAFPWTERFDTRLDTSPRAHAERIVLEDPVPEATATKILS